MEELNEQPSKASDEEKAEIIQSQQALKKQTKKADTCEKDLQKIAGFAK